MGHRCGRHVEPVPGRPPLRGPDRELGLVGPGRAAARGCVTPGTCVGAKAVQRRKGGPAKRHVGADRIPDRAVTLGHPAVGAADDPVELRREPARAPRLPAGVDPAARAEDVGVRERGRQLLEPVRGRGGGVVVEEGDRAASGRGGPALRAPERPLAKRFGTTVACVSSLLARARALRCDRRRRSPRSACDSARLPSGQRPRVVPTAPRCKRR